MAAQLSATFTEPEPGPEPEPEDLEVPQFDAANQDSDKPAQASIASVV